MAPRLRASQGDSVDRGAGSGGRPKPKKGGPAPRGTKETGDWGVFRTVVVAVGVLIAGIGVY